MDEAFKRKVLAEYSTAKLQRNGAKVLKKYNVSREAISLWVGKDLDKTDRAEEKKAAAPLTATLGDIVSAARHKGQKRRMPATAEEKVDFLRQFYQAKANAGQGRELMVEYGIGDLKKIREWKRQFRGQYGEVEPMEPQRLTEEHETRHTEEHGHDDEVTAAPATRPALKPMMITTRAKAAEYTRLERAVILAQHAAALDRDDKAELLRRYQLSTQTLMNWRNSKAVEHAFDAPVMYSNKPIYTNAQKHLVLQAFYACPTETRTVFLRALNMDQRLVASFERLLTKPGELERRKAFVDEYMAIAEKSDRGAYIRNRGVSGGDLSKWHVEEYGHHMRAPMGITKRSLASVSEPHPHVELVPHRRNGAVVAHPDAAANARLEELELANRLLRQLVAEAEAQGFDGRSSLMSRLLGEI